MNNPMLELIKTRRSIRRFTAQPVPAELVRQVAEAGTYAPTGRNRQSPIIVAVTDRATRDRLSEANRLLCDGQEGFDPFYGAPAVLIVLGDKSCPHYLYDGSMVMQNLMLAAHALGLGSCWIHRAKEEFQQPQWQQWLKGLGIEGDYEGIGHCILGYPEGDAPEASPRKEHWVYYV